MIFDYEILKKDIEKIVGKQILFISYATCTNIEEAKQVSEQYSSTTGVLFWDKDKPNWYVTVR